MFSATPRTVPAPLLLASALALLAPAFGCSDLGTHELEIDASEAVAQGVVTADDWTVEFERFVVVVHDPGLIERVDNRPTWVREYGVTIWDVSAELGEDDALSRMIRASSYDGADFRVAPASESGYEAAAGNVDDATVDAAVADDWSLHVVGSAIEAGTMQTVSFDWTFATSTLYRCELEGDEVVELGAEGEETTVIEILGEALLREAGSEAEPDAALAFAPIAAADADGDGAVTRGELESAGLWEQLEGLSKRIGGIRGAGECPMVDE